MPVINFQNNDAFMAWGRSQGYWGTYNDIMKAYLSGLAVAFSPSSLFEEGELGAWWDCQDLSTMFSDDAMTIPAVVNGVVAVHLDKSGNNNHRVQTADANRPILRQRVDGIYYLDYAGGKTIKVANSMGTFNYLHNGTGGTLAAYIEWPQSTASSRYIRSSVSTSQIGIQTSKSTTTQSVSLDICRGVSGQLASQISVNRFAVSSLARLLLCSYKNDGTSTDSMAVADFPRNFTTGSTINPPSSSNATNDMQVDSNFLGREYECIIRQGVLTQEQMEQLYAYTKLRNDYPVTDIDLTLICGGQSNMSGRGIITGTPLPEEKLIGVYSYNRSEEYKLAGIPEHNVGGQPVPTVPPESSPTAPQHGFILKAGKDVKIGSDKNTLLVPCAVGGTWIYEWDTPGTVSDPTTLLGAMKARYNIASSKGGTPVIVWFGHENDVSLAVPDYTNGGVGTGYQDAFVSLMNTVRNNVVDAPIIFIQLGSNDVEVKAVKQAAAGEAMRQVELSLPNTYMVPAYDLERNVFPDDIHISRNGHVALGARVALCIREKILGEAINGTGPRLVSVYSEINKVIITFDKEVKTSATNYDNMFAVYSEGVKKTISSVVRGTDTSTIVITCTEYLTIPLTVTYGFIAGVASGRRTDIVRDNSDIPTPVFGPVADPVSLGVELFTGQSSTVINSGGGAVYTHTPAGRKLDITVVGTADSYPRIRVNAGLEVGKTYRISGKLIGSTGNLHPTIPIRLANSGTANTLIYDPATGFFGGDIVAADASVTVLYDGRILGTIEIPSMSIREIL